MYKILIIEDNEDNMDLINSYLEDEFELINAYDGRSGLQKANDLNPDLILLDISLPLMDGNEVLKHIRKNEKIKNIPVIALTAHAMKGDREKYLQIGFDEYISKPIIDDEYLIETINKLIKEDR